MGEFIVRLSSLTLQNIKNVKKGTVFMPMANEKSLNVGGAEILGIYGQNGSGKTAVVDGLYFLQQIMIGETIDQSISDYIGVDDDAAHMNAEFKILGGVAPSCTACMFSFILTNSNGSNKAPLMTVW